MAIEDMFGDLHKIDILAEKTETKAAFYAESADRKHFFAKPMKFCKMILYTTAFFCYTS